MKFRVGLGLKRIRRGGGSLALGPPAAVSLTGDARGSGQILGAILEPHAPISVSGDVTGAGDAAGVLTVSPAVNPVPLEGDIASAGNTAGTLSVQPLLVPLAGDVAATGDLSGTLSVEPPPVSLSGDAVAMGDAAGVLSVLPAPANMAGDAEGTGSVEGTVIVGTATTGLVGNVEGVGDVAGTLTVGPANVSLAGDAAGSGQLAGTATVAPATASLSGDAAGSGQAAGTLTAAQPTVNLSGDVSASGQAAGTLTVAPVLVPLAGDAAGSGQTAGAFNVSPVSLSGDAAASGSIAGTITGEPSNVTLAKASITAGAPAGTSLASFVESDNLLFVAPVLTKASITAGAPAGTAIGTFDMPLTYTLTDNAGGKVVIDGLNIELTGTAVAGPVNFAYRATRADGWSKVFNDSVTVGAAVGGTVATPVIATSNVPAPDTYYKTIDVTQSDATAGDNYIWVYAPYVTGTVSDLGSDPEVLTAVDPTSGDTNFTVALGPFGVGQWTIALKTARPGLTTSAYSNCLTYNRAAGDVTAPTITSGAAVSVAENATLSHALTANETVAWSLVGGSDLSHFELSGATLRWVSNGVKDFEAPGDTGANNTYVVTVRATDLAGNTNNQTITVTVTDIAEGGFLPSDVSGTAAWWEADDAATVLTTGGVQAVAGNSVSQLSDQIGTHHLKNASEGPSRPVLEAAAMNGLAALRFNSSETGDGEDYFFTDPFTAYTGTTLYALVACTLQNGGRAWGRVLGFGNGGEDGQGATIAVIRNSNTNNIELVHNSNGSSTIAVSPDVKFLLEILADGSNISMRVNGGTTITVAQGGSFNISRLGLGSMANTGKEGHSGLISAGYVNLGTVSSGDRTSLRSYFGTKYGITV